MHTRPTMTPLKCQRMMEYAKKVVATKGDRYDWRPDEEAFESTYPLYPTPNDSSSISLIVRINEALDTKDAKAVAYIHEVLAHAVVKIGKVYLNRSDDDMADLMEIYLVFSHWSAMLELFLKMKRGHIHSSNLDAEISLLE